jgi:hypothetical protein
MNGVQGLLVEEWIQDFHARAKYFPGWIDILCFWKNKNNAIGIYD